MSQYKTLDALILWRLETFAPTVPATAYRIDCMDVAVETARLARLLGRSRAQVVCGRLQALRKAGRIEFSAGCWRLKP